MTSVALVTGASRGIGRELADDFASRGFDLILVARHEDRLRASAAVLRTRYGSTIHCIAVDICELDQVKRRVRTCLDQYECLDVLVNAAGILRIGTSAVGCDDLGELLTTNVIAVHNLCQACHDALAASRRPHIFNISSIAGLEGYARLGGYAASKFAVLGYGQSLEKELIAENIKVTTICPDLVATDMSGAFDVAPEDMISCADIRAAVDFVMRLSGPALVNTIVIRRKAAVGMLAALEMIEEKHNGPTGAPRG